jgi:hypothetical protein
LGLAGVLILLLVRLIVLWQGHLLGDVDVLSVTGRNAVTACETQAVTRRGTALWHGYDYRDSELLGTGYVSPYGYRGRILAG